MTFSITPGAPFSLDAAAAFGFGPNTGRPAPERGVMRLAMVTDDLVHHAGELLTVTKRMKSDKSSARNG